jgi:hypothetical protein
MNVSSSSPFSIEPVKIPNQQSINPAKPEIRETVLNLLRVAATNFQMCVYP